MSEMKVQKKFSIQAEINVSPDKSITHRAIMFASLSSGECIINNYLNSKDCYSTIEAFRNLGIEIIEEKNRVLKVYGKGINGLSQPKHIIDAGNSGTTVRLLLGILSGNEIEVTIVGDESLSKRPMARVIEPLSLMGAKIIAKENNYLPIKIIGNKNLKSITWTSKIPSAQLKSSILFAGMYANGETIYKEPVLSRDHTERMMQYLKLPISKKELVVSIKGKVKEIKPFEITIPDDPSSASYFIAMGVLVPNSSVLIKNVCINPTRIGFINVLIKMGAKISFINPRVVYNEPVADIKVESSKLKSIKITEDIVPSMIDELPLLAVVATQADGVTEIKGAQELRVKESDRIKSIVTELQKLGAKVIEQPDGMIIMGNTPLKASYDNILESYNDHRIAMSLAVAGSICEGEVIIKNAECVEISFPDFWNLYRSI